MKVTTALVLPLAGLSLAQLPWPLSSYSKTPYVLQVQTGFANGCLDATKLGMSLDDQALVFDMAQFYADINGAKKSPRIMDYGVCVMQMNLKLPDGWRFRFTNATYTGHAKASGGAYIPYLLTTTYLQYMYSNYTPNGDLVDRTFRGTELADYQVTTNFGKTADYDADFEVTGSASYGASAWSPCMGDYDSSRIEFRLQMQTHAGFARPNGTYEEVKDQGEAVIGSQTKGIKVRLGLEYEKCDPAKNPIDSWGQKRGSRGEWLPPVNDTNPVIPH